MLWSEFPDEVATHLVSDSKFVAFVSLDKVPQPYWVQQHVTWAGPAHMYICSIEQLEDLMPTEVLTRVKDVALIIKSETVSAHDPPLAAANLDIVVLHVTLMHQRATLARGL